MKRTTPIIFTSVLAISLFTQQTYARGFIAGILEDGGVITSEQSEQLDGIHANLGNPLDHAARGAATYYAPGSVQAHDAIRNFGYNTPQPVNRAPQPFYRTPPPYYGVPQPYFNNSYGYYR